MKKIVMMILCVVAVLGLAACGKDDKKGEIKIGLICLHDENSTYDKNFIDAMKEMQKDLGLSDDQIIIKTNIDETSACLDACKDLVDHGCTLIFADSFGHEDFMIQAAKQFKDVQFCHATGTRAHTEKLPNYHNAFANIYEGRYAAGVRLSVYDRDDKAVERRHCGREAVEKGTYHGRTCSWQAPCGK